MINKELQKILLTMTKADQDLRFNPQKIKTKFHVIDTSNTEKLKKIIKQYGWPDQKLVGIKGAQAAWLITQHADHDLSFQKKCLVLMKEKYKEELVGPKDVALLIDRVLVNSGKSQKYGTQFYTNKKGEYTFRPISVKKSVNKRRKEMGLDTFESYQAHIQKVRAKHIKKYDLK